MCRVCLVVVFENYSEKQFFVFSETNCVWELDSGK